MKFCLRVLCALLRFGEVSGLPKMVDRSELMIWGAPRSAAGRDEKYRGK